MMPTEKLNRLVIVLFLGFLTVSAFFIRLENFKNSPARSIDEVVYFRMATQVLASGPAGYQTIPYGRELAATGRPLPKYFFEPLFKHPPLFTFLIALAMKIFGMTPAAAAFIPIFFGVLLIPLTYRLGALVFDRWAGLAAAFFMWLDPFTIICSQKVWMETVLSFFFTLAMYWFIQALKTQKDIYFLLSGIASGLGALTKYTGGFATAVIFLFALFIRRDLLKKVPFWYGVVLPFLFLVPWFTWNLHVYGWHYWAMQGQLHSDAAHTHAFLLHALAYSILTCAGILLVRKLKADLSQKVKSFQTDGVPAPLLKLLGIIFFGMMAGQIVPGLALSAVPATSWAGATFYGSPPTFYFYRLILFSPIYIFGFLYFFLPRPGKCSSEEILLILGVIFNFLFYMMWGSFQSRYILAVEPPLLVFGSVALLEWYRRSTAISLSAGRILSQSFIILVVVYLVLKVQLINFQISFPNNLCYF